MPVFSKFQFTPLREGRPLYANDKKQTELFQFTPLREGRLSRCPRVRASGKFQFTPLREGRRMSYTTATPTKYFNSRPSARGDLGVILVLLGAYKFQFTPLREGRPPRRCTPHRASRISIHAPPRGATYTAAAAQTVANDFNSRPSARGDCNTEGIFDPRFISIHAPPRGATRAKKCA